MAAYIGPAALEKIRNYRYASGMYSPVDTYVLNPFWNWAVTLVPLWVAPNALTLAALWCCLSAYALVVAHCPTLTEEAPPWVFGYSAAAVFAYQTLDAIDGKQARRTASSSPLGQLFDHGCDAVSAILFATLVAAALRAGSAALTPVLLLLHVVPFFVKNWEACHTDFMKHDVVGVSEAQLLIIGVMGATAAWGHAIWDAQFPGTSHSVALVVLSAALAFAGWQTLVGVVAVRRSLDEHGAPAAERSRAWSQLAQFALYVALVVAWYACPTTDVWQRHTVATLAVSGVVFAYHVTMLIVAHVSGQPYPFWTPVLTPLPAVVANAYARGLFGAAFCDTPVLFIYGAFISCVYLHYVFGVVGELCQHLGIRALSIPPPKSVGRADY